MSIEEGFEKLFLEHYDQLFQLSFNVLRDETSAHDVVHDVFEHLWKKKEEIKITSSMQSYLKKSIVNKAINHLKAHRKHISLEPNHIKDHYEQSPEIKDVDEDFNLLLESALQQLTPTSRTVFILSRMEGLDNQEIADYLGVAKKTVENHLSIALKNLRVFLEAKKNRFPHLFSQMVWLL
ncbi:RNA polymerase sigma-70 factor [Fulvivirgaceae bacterium BMA10]|uniref:RNA polymerase sigma-70 factor n=1 Tax=Splendidivirga corallicola TaxID=3051826 RepID=A0ABT8KXW4_9BACT|nr:RNA polymerase sigma-70 factor [Fulvivirgaceae bacterium BMA10]